MVDWFQLSQFVLNGLIVGALYGGEAGWLKEPFLQSDRRPAAAKVVLVYRGLPPGRYAVSLFHDENGNGKLDTIAGIPREGFGFSRNPPIRFGPPRFNSARFTVAGTGDRQQVKMRYLL